MARTKAEWRIGYDFLGWPFALAIGAQIQLVPGIWLPRLELRVSAVLLTIGWWPKE